MEWRNSKPPISGDELRKWRNEQARKTRYIVQPSKGGWVVWDRRKKEAASKVIPRHLAAVDMCIRMDAMFREKADE